jgi:hypothetical protein
MTLIDICELKYPGQIAMGNIGFRQEWHYSPIEIIKWTVPGIEKPLEANLLAEISDYQLQYDRKTAFIEYVSYIENMLDEEAKTKNYGSSLSITTYIASTNPQWVAEAETFIAWRDAVYVYALGVQEQVETGVIPIPDLSSFIEGIPAIVWP